MDENELRKLKRQIEEAIPWRDGVLTVDQARALIQEVERWRTHCWQEEDPRQVLDGTHRIVVYDPNLRWVGLADVVVQAEVYAIFVEGYPKDPDRTICDGDAWPRRWVWAQGPRLPLDSRQRSR